MPGQLLEKLEEKRQRAKQCPACLESVDEHASWCSFFAPEGEQYDEDESVRALELL